MPRPWWLLLLLVFASCLQLGSCPSRAGEACEPRNAACPQGYYCALAEVCTRACTETKECWVPATNGCISNEFPGMTVPDGGGDDPTPDGFCPQSKHLLCLEGFCQHERCLDGGCDYDLYGPSPFKGNRTQGPAQ